MAGYIVLGIALFIVFCMYLSARSDLKDTETKLSNTEERITREICKEHYKQVDDLCNLLNNTSRRSGETRKMHDRIFGYNVTKSKIFKENLEEKINELKQGIEKKVNEAQQKLDKINDQIAEAQQELDKIKQEHTILLTLIDKSNSNLEAIPYMSALMADYETYVLEASAQSLNWGYSVKRMEKVASIREIRKAAQAMVEKNLESKYQLEYLLKLFPNLEDVIETDYNQLPNIKIEDLSEYDRSRDWLSKEEYQSLGSVERNQLALDRYKESHNKTKWQIGRDYELYVGYKYSQKGYSVDYFGSYMGMEDLGRDLICKKGKDIIIVQCKYWSQVKQIHEKHITQLYGTMISYCIENDLPKSAVKGILITNINLSEMAKKMAGFLKIQYNENYKLEDYPCIKCNIGHYEGTKSKIYHLPFDQQYDSTKIDKPGEFYAMTVQEAEAAGFRRAFKWFGSS